MNRAAALVVGVVLFILLVAGGALGIRDYVRERCDAAYEAGHAAAVAAGKVQRDLDAAVHLKKETDLRAKLAAKEANAHRKEQEYATNLEAAQRRVRTGTDRLRCPAAGPVHPTAAAADGPATAGAPADGPGPDVVPEAAADILGIAADVAGLVRRYERLAERFDACRALNEVP